MEGKEGKEGKLEARIFIFCQYEYNPKTKENLYFNESNIKSCIGHKSIKQYAYIKHDKDIQQEDDEEKGYKKGDPVGVHWQGVFRTKPALPVETIARWLGIPANQIQVPKGQGAFLDCVEYLTHESDKEQAKGKHHYTDEEVIANFDFRKELSQRVENRLKYGGDLTATQRMFWDILYDGKTIREVISENKILYMENFKKVDGYRLKHILQCDPPNTRINFYVSGKGGTGKGLLSRAIARSLYPNLKSDDDIFFTVGDGKATFEGYDGQPVIIWNDCRSIELFQILGSRGNIFRVFDPHPQKERQNIKFGSINLINSVNIVNSVQPYVEFLNGLSGEYTSGGVSYKSEDKGQSFRRFPFIVDISEEEFVLLLNKGFVENSKNYLEYMEYMHIVGNFEKIAIACGDNKEIRRKIEEKTIKPITDKYNEIMSNMYQEMSETEIENMFKNYGCDTNYINAIGMPLCKVEL